MKNLIAALFVFWTLLSNASVYASETLSYIPENPQNALVVIHGYGQSGARMKYLAKKLQPYLPDTAFYFPTAPDRAPHGGYQWFVLPILGEELSQEALYQKMMHDALRNVKKLKTLTEEIHKEHQIPYQNIAVAGFSQGGLMALLTALTSSHNIAKAVSFSGVPLLFTADFTPSLVKNVPDALIIQGDRDGVIPADSLNMTAETLEKLKITYEISHIKGMRHEINEQALQDMVDFLQ